MRVLRVIGAAALLLLLLVLFVLGRLGAADPAVSLRSALTAAGFESASVDILAAEGGASTVVIEFDPMSQSAAAVELLSRRAAELAWTRGEIESSTVSVRPVGGPVLDVGAAELARAGTPPAVRQRYAEVSGRAGRVVALAVVAVLLTLVLVVCASVAAVLVGRRRRAPGFVGGSR